jgi:hypothetical protein
MPNIKFIKAPVHQLCIQSISDCIRVQSLTELTTQKILVSSAKKNISKTCNEIIKFIGKNTK